MSPLAGRYLAPLPAQPLSSGRSRPHSAGKITGGHVRSVLQLRSQPQPTQGELADSRPSSGRSRESQARSAHRESSESSRTPASSSSAPELRPGSAPQASRSPWNIQFRKWSLRAPKAAYASNATLQPNRGRHHNSAQLPKKRRRALDSRRRLDMLSAPALLQMRQNLQNAKGAIYLQQPPPQTGPEIRMQGDDDEDILDTDIMVSGEPSPIEGQSEGVNKLNLLVTPLSAPGQEFKSSARGPNVQVSARGAAMSPRKPGFVSPRPPQVHRKNSRGTLEIDNKNAADKEKGSAPPTPGADSSSHSSALRELSKEKSSFDFDLEKMPKEKRWESAFQRMQQHGEIHRDSLVAGLELAGFAKPREEWIEEAMKELTSFSTLDKDEFSRLLEIYEAKQLEHYQGIFEQFDDDGSGSLDEEELAKVLEHCGITALSQVIKEIVTEVAPVDPNGITLDEFKRLLEIIYTNEGFSKREVLRLMEVFHKFDFDRDGTLDIGELHKAIRWLCYAVPEQEIRRISDSVDVGGKGELEEHEFIVCMRKVKEREINHVKKAIKGVRLDNNNLLRYLDAVLRSLGYIPDPQAIQDSAEDAGILQVRHRPNTSGNAGGRRTSNARRMSGTGIGGVGMARRASFGAARLAVPPVGLARSRTASCGSIENVQGLPGAENMTHDQLLMLIMPKPIGLSEVFLFLEVYRRREGMDRTQIMELELAFHKYDKEGHGEMNVMDVGKVLRWLGYAVSFDVQQRLVKEVDVDQSGSLDIGEMRKLARIFREKELLSWTDTFKKRDKAKTGVMSIDACIHTLRAIGVQATAEEVGQIRASRRPITNPKKSQSFVDDSSSRSGMGSSEEDDEQKKKKKPAKKKKEGSKDTASSTLTSSSGGTSSSDSDSDFGSDCNGSTSSEGGGAKARAMAPPKEGIDLVDFQLICSKLVAKARDAFRGNAGYTGNEVEKMRESFKKYDEDGSGSIDNQEIAKLMTDLFPDAASNPTRRAELSKILAEVDENGDGSLDFPDFLRLMRQFDDMQERSRIAKEELAMSKVQFTPAEVDDFRQLFLGKEQPDGSYRNALPFDQFCELIQKVVKLTRKQQEELHENFAKVEVIDAGSQKTSASPTDQLRLNRAGSAPAKSNVDFPEFLLLMDLLLAADFAGIRENSERIAEHERQRQKWRGTKASKNKSF